MEFDQTASTLIEISPWIVDITKPNQAEQTAFEYLLKDIAFIYNVN